MSKQYPNGVPLSQVGAMAGAHTGPGPAPAKPMTLPVRISYGVVGVLAVCALTASIATAAVPAWFDKGTLKEAEYELRTPATCGAWERKLQQCKQLRRSIDQCAESYMYLAKCRAGLAVPDVKSHTESAAERIARERAAR